MKPVIIRIPKWSRRVLALFPRWRETLLTHDTRIATHAHAFAAMYFTYGVKALEGPGGARLLPPAAMVIVPAGAAHGWQGVASGSTAIVGHYHPGHPAHEIETARASLS